MSKLGKSNCIAHFSEDKQKRNKKRKRYVMEREPIEKIHTIKNFRETMVFFATGANVPERLTCMG